MGPPILNMGPPKLSVKLWWDLPLKFDVWDLPLKFDMWDFPLIVV